MAVAALVRSTPARPRPAAVWRHVADASAGVPSRDSWRSVMERLCLPYVETAAEPSTPRGHVLWMASDNGAEFTRVDATPQKIAGRYPKQSTGVWLSALIAGEAELEVDGQRHAMAPGAILYGPTGAAAAVEYHTPFRQLFVKLPQATIHPRLLAPSGLTVGRLDPAHGSTRMLFAILRRQTIEARLSDPEVSLEDVAAAHRISPRYLQKLFKSADETFSHYILARRLERCRADLADPMCAQLSISQICFRWGFNGSAHFSRAFRDRYGMSPREHRRAAATAAEVG